jgi:hypothetical protein
VPGTDRLVEIHHPGHRKPAHHNEILSPKAKTKVFA